MSTTLYPWEICPLDKEYAATDLNGRREWFEVEPGLMTDVGLNCFSCKGSYQYIDDNGNGEEWQDSVRKIPDREKELNRAVSEYRGLVQYYKANDRSKFDFSVEEFRERRKQRINAGLIDTNDANAADIEVSKEAVKPGPFKTEIGKEYVVQVPWSNPKVPLPYSEPFQKLIGKKVIVLAQFIDGNVPMVTFREGLDYHTLGEPWLYTDELNDEQQWLLSQLEEWPEGHQAVTRGPLDQIIPVLPRECTKQYCLTESQYRLHDVVNDVADHSLGDIG